MNRFPGRRFTKGLSSGLFIWAVFAFGYQSQFMMISVEAAGNLHITQEKSSQEDLKNLPEKSGAITSKQEVHQTTPVPDGQSLAKPSAVDESKGVAGEAQQGEGELQDFQATAYCLKGRTASGEYARSGIIAADPKVLPLGTVVHIRAGRYTGTYTVKDTGGRIKGRKVDIYIPNYREAKAFGRRRIKVKVIGKNPPATQSTPKN
ncbi:MAG: 3D domain-containing protein [Blastocatellia bacterium]|nr:3D domain-containing protein [Blastocatellia bacterium]